MFFIIFFTFSDVGSSSFAFLKSEIILDEQSTPKSDEINNSSNSSKVESSIFLLFKIFWIPPDILSDDLYSNNFIKSLVKIKLHYNNINKLYKKKYSNHYQITKDLFDKSIIYKVLNDKLPLELIKHICKFINTEVKFSITIHKSLSNDKNYYLSNPSLHFSDYIIPS